MSSTVPQSSSNAFPNHLLVLGEVSLNTQNNILKICHQEITLSKSDAAMAGLFMTQSKQGHLNFSAKTGAELLGCADADEFKEALSQFRENMSTVLIANAYGYNQHNYALQSLVHPHTIFADSLFPDQLDGHDRYFFNTDLAALVNKTEMINDQNLQHIQIQVDQEDWRFKGSFQSADKKPAIPSFQK